MKREEPRFSNVKAMLTKDQMKKIKAGAATSFYQCCWENGGTCGACIANPSCLPGQSIRAC